MSVAVARRRLVAALPAALALGLAGSAREVFAQTVAYPERLIKVIVPYPPAALTDALGRLFAENLRVALGQPVVVENRAGAGTLLGAAVVAKGPADGYQLLIATSTTLAISPAMFASPPALPTDFTGVAMIGSVSLLLVTRPDLKVASLPELVALIRKEPGRYTFGSPGNGTMHQLIVEMVKVQEKLAATHVPYQGSSAALGDLMSGRIDFMFLDVVAALPQVKAGKLNAIAVAAAQRLPTLPGLATVAEIYPRHRRPGVAIGGGAEGHARRCRPEAQRRGQSAAQRSRGEEVAAGDRRDGQSDVDHGAQRAHHARREALRRPGAHARVEGKLRLSERRRAIAPATSPTRSPPAPARSPRRPASAVARRATPRR